MSSRATRHRLPALRPVHYRRHLCNQPVGWWCWRRQRHCAAFALLLYLDKRLCPWRDEPFRNAVGCINSELEPPRFRAPESNACRPRNSAVVQHVHLGRKLDRANRHCCATCCCPPRSATAAAAATAAALPTRPPLRCPQQQQQQQHRPPQRLACT